MEKSRDIERRDFLRGAAALAAGGMAAASLGAMPALAEAPAPGTLRPISIVNAAGTTFNATRELITRLGYLKEFGVEPEFTAISDSVKIVASIVSGQMDLCMGVGFGPIIPAVEKGARVKVLAGAWMLAPNTLFTSRPGIRTLDDLAGKTVGTGAVGAVLHLLMVAALQKHGIDPARVNFVNVGSTGDIFKAVAAGTIDAGVVNVDAYEQKDRYKLHPVVDFWTELPEFPFQASFASDAAIKAKRDTIVRTLAAYARLYRFMAAPDSRDAYVSAYVAGNGGGAEAAAKQWQFIQDSQCYAVDLLIPDAKVRYMQELNVEMKVQRAIVPNAMVADMSLAQEALKLIKG
jgi:ABC-type nitrate/sulfonate/bicarbonate transport system substrate-binding protein